jgi:dTDP-4-amino-4,6-dideoxygalactose transaminase
VDNIAEVLASGLPFRYRAGSACQHFEERWAEYLGVRHVMLTSSGTTALVAALAGLGVGPGDEVIVPAHTFMATAVAALGVGAIPVIVDVDESLTMSPAALEAAAGPRTRAVIPVHMWGLPADMDAITAVASRHDLLVIEDACQGVGGGYHGRKLGSMGAANAFSFNYYKNMTSGEGGAVTTNDDHVAEVARCMVDSARFFWTGRSGDMPPFAAIGARASEIQGAMLNAQLDRLPRLLALLRTRKERIMAATVGVAGLQANPRHSPADECGTYLHYLLPSAAAAVEFAAATAGTIAANTGRHNYTEWDPILGHRAGPHPRLNPFLWPENAACRMEYSADMCAPSLEILRRTVMITARVSWSEAEVDELIERITDGAQRAAAAV